MTEYATRAAQVVASLDPDARIALLSGRDFWTTEALPDHGLPATLMTDGPHGLRKQDSAVDHIGMGASVPATCFPTAASLASTWDVDVVTRVGEALGQEAAALDVSLLLGPGLNLKRHPAGGRNFEYFSEDPLLSGTMAAAHVRGVQSQGVGACLKHYAVNNQESDRFRVDTIVDERTERELYLRGFEIAVRDGQPWAVMSSYNRVRGEHVGESVRLVAELLRGEFGFDGMVVSDWLAVADRVAGVRAGLDLEMPGSHGVWDKLVKRAVARGDLPQSSVDAAAARVVEFMMRAAAAREARGDVSVDFDAHDALAREVAARGTVLLSNDGILPIADPEGLAVIGAFAQRPRYQGAGSSLVNPVRLTSTVDALEAKGVSFTYTPGYDPVTGEVTEQSLQEAVRVASAAGTVLLLLGLPASWETEGLDRPHCDLPPGMDSLASAVIAANPRTVVSIAAGSAVTMPWADQAAAVLFSYLAGQASGGALADVLLGHAEPSGRLAESFPVRASDLPADAFFAKHPTQVQHREGQWVGYRFHDTWGVPARFPFGHGLGYGDFEFEDATAVAGQGAVPSAVTVTVRNRSARAARAVVQVYASSPATTVQRPAQVLAGFAAAQVTPGAAVPVTVTLDEQSFRVFDAATGRWVLEAGDYELRIGASSVDIRSVLPVRIESADAVDGTTWPRTAGPVATEAEFASLLGAPVQAPKPLRPFHMESTMADLKATWIGRLVRKAIEKEASKSMGGDEPDDVAESTAGAYLDGMPLRALAMASEGAVSLRAVGAIIVALNVLSGPRRR